ncbi:MAG: MBL fold metallo-hydrolase [bacterium]|nr:MBL fold metallo-hydrolase [bacterium]
MGMLEFTPLGGGSEIGANSYMLHEEGHRILLDCGLHPKKEGRDALPDFSLLQEPPEAVLISHAHIDHCGAIPYLYSMFNSIECYTTTPTLDIMDRMLHNSVSVMGMLELEQGIVDYPLYSHRDVDRAIRRTYGLGYRRAFDLTWDSPFRASFHSAGHVLGSASILVTSPGHTLLYTGDICTNDQELLGGLTPPSDDLEVDTLVIESTRAMNEDAKNTTFGREVSRFAKAAKAVLDKGGVVLVPVFALGRSQELLNAIARLIETGRLPDVPVYASGLGRAVYEVYNKHPQYLRPDATLRPLQEFPRIGDVWEKSVRRDLLREPCIIAATSGMMVENTPSAMLAMEMVRHENHGIFFVGYLDPETPGYKLLHANIGDTMRFERNGAEQAILLKNRQSFALSAHATREDLCGFVDRIQPKNVVFVHGDADAVAWMQENCTGPYRTYTPVGGETIPLEA